MKFLPMILANMRRKKIRTLLTVGSFVISFFLFGLLTTIDHAFYEGVDVAGADRLLVLNKTSLTLRLPVSYKNTIQRIDGVEAVTYATWFGGVYQHEKNFFPQFAIEAETYRTVYSEYRVPEDQWQSFLGDRQGAIVGRKTFEKHQWKIGDRIPIQGSIYPGLWEFNIRGVYDGEGSSVDTTKFWFHHPLIDERNPYESGMIGAFVIKIKDSGQAAAVSSAIDARFENSPFETRTITEKAFAASFVKQIGNIRFILLLVCGVVFFTLLLITGSNIAISVKERTNEIAILKVLGFSGNKIVYHVFLETVSYALIGALTGLGLCKLFTLAGDPTNGLLPLFYLAPAKIGIGMLIALFAGMVSGIIPAIIITKLQIADAIRRV